MSVCGISQTCTVLNRVGCLSYNRHSSSLGFLKEIHCCGYDVRHELRAVQNLPCCCGSTCIASYELNGRRESFQVRVKKLRYFKYVRERRTGTQFCVGGRPSYELSKVIANGCSNELFEKYELRVCTQKACRKSGSLQTLDVLRSMAPAAVSVDSCGCLGKCGAGPNLVVLPAELLVSHCSTAAHAARLLALQCRAENPDNNLKALAIKQKGNKAFEQGDLLLAEKLYTEAIETNPSGGLHFILANRSAVLLARGDPVAALQDAKEACRIAPLWGQGQLRQAEALFGLGYIDGAKNACQRALHLDPSLRRSKSLQGLDWVSSAM